MANAALAFGVLASILLFARHYANIALDDVASEGSGDLVLTVPKPTPPRDLFSYTAILEKNSFGESAAGPLTAIGNKAQNGNKDSGVVAEGLILVGTIAGEGSYGFGIFEDKKKQQSVFRVGTEIPGHGMLVKVESDFVVLDTPQGERRINIADLAKVADKQPMSTRNYKGRAGRARNRSKSKRITKDVDFIRQTGEQKFVLDKEGVQKSLQNPQRVLTDARMLPNIVDNKQDGFKVSEVKRGGIYDELGLQNGDILLKINDLELNSPDSGMQAFGTLKGMDQIKLFLVRDEKKITLTYQVR